MKNKSNYGSALIMQTGNYLICYDNFYCFCDKSFTYLPWKLTAKLGIFVNYLEYGRLKITGCKKINFTHIYEEKLKQLQAVFMKNPLTGLSKKEIDYLKKNVFTKDQQQIAEVVTQKPHCQKLSKEMRVVHLATKKTEVVEHNIHAGTIANAPGFAKLFSLEFKSGEEQMSAQ